MSGGYFDHSYWVFQNTADDLQHFVNKQQMYKDNKVNPTLPTGDWDHELSDNTLQRIQSLVFEMQEVAEKFKEVDYLLSGDNSEESFDEIWNEKDWG